jgi:hypothetical protein
VSPSLHPSLDWQATSEECMAWVPAMASVEHGESGANLIELILKSLNYYI